MYGIIKGVFLYFLPYSMQLTTLESQVEGKEKLLEKEKSAVESAEQRNKQLLEELADLKQDLESVKKDRDAEAAESKPLSFVVGTMKETRPRFCFVNGLNDSSISFSRNRRNE